MRPSQEKVVPFKSAYRLTDAQGSLQVGFELRAFVRDGPSANSFSARLENKRIRSHDVLTFLDDLFLMVKI